MSFFLEKVKLDIDANDIKLIDKKNEKRLELGKLPEETEKSLDEKIKFEFIHSTCRIEGNTYSLGETEALIKFGITASGKSLKEAEELKNQEQAIKYILLAKHKNFAIDEKLIKKIHSLVGKNVVRRPGQYRNGPVFIIGSSYKPKPTLAEIQAQMRDLINYINQDQFKNKHPIEQSILLNFALSYIQAFFDGNKRTARLLQNLILIKNNYPFITFRMQDVALYRDAIVTAYEEFALNKLSSITLEQIDMILELYLSVNT